MTITKTVNWSLWIKIEGLKPYEAKVNMLVYIDIIMTQVLPTVYTIEPTMVNTSF